jgi:hypothetical protein
LVAVIVGLIMAFSSSLDSDRTHLGELVIGIFILAGIPIILIFGLAYIRSGQKRKSGSNLDTLPAMLRALEAIPCPECGKTIDARNFVRDALLKESGATKS